MFADICRRKVVFHDQSIIFSPFLCFQDIKFVMMESISVSLCLDILVNIINQAQHMMET